jgi:hypothetical protein
MSRHGHRVRTTPRPPRIDRPTAEQAARISARLRGCTCGDHLTIRFQHRDNGDAFAFIEHRDGCPALTAAGVVSTWRQTR